MGWLDLHIHSSASSDGEFSPLDLLQRCVHSGIRVLAIADHNTTKGSVEAVPIAEKSGLELIPAIEMDCVHNSTNIHILGYNVDLGAPRFAELENEYREKEFIAGEKLRDHICALGLVIDWDAVLDLAQNRPVNAEMIAEIMLGDKANRNNDLLIPYRNGNARSDNPYVNFYWDYCSQGKPAYAHIEYALASEAISCIHRAGGIAVMAHPYCNIGKNKDFLVSLSDNGLDGIEAFSSYHTVEQSEYFRRIGQELELILSLGSDFHGKTKPKVRLGEVAYGGDIADIAYQFINSMGKWR